MEDWVMCKCGKAKEGSVHMSGDAQTVWVAYKCQKCGKAWVRLYRYDFSYTTRQPEDATQREAK